MNYKIQLTSFLIIDRYFKTESKFDVLLQEIEVHNSDELKSSITEEIYMVKYKFTKV